ncbi:MAG: hypothetical protein V9E83_05265 [Baekduia sp.]
MRARSLCCGALAILAFLAAPAGAGAALLDVDRSFGAFAGGDGAASLFAGTNPGLSYRPPFEVVQAPAGGYAVVTGVASGGGYAISDTRFTSSGTPSESARTYRPGNAAVGFTIKATGDGSGGYYAYGTRQRGDEERLFVAHIGVNRELDPAFGSGGVVELPARPGRATPQAITRQSDGSLVLLEIRSGMSTRDAVVYRMLPNGTLDQSFSGDGATEPIIVTAFGQGTLVDLVTRITDGSITAVGSAGSAGRIRLVRWTAGGSLDSGYGLGGVASPDPAPSDIYPVAAGIDSSGRILVFGSESPAPQKASVTRITTAGAIDTTFGGGDGIVDGQASSATGSTVTDGLVAGGSDVLYVGQSTFGSAPTTRTTFWKTSGNGTSVAVTADTSTTVDAQSVDVIGSKVVTAGDNGTIRSVGWTYSSAALNFTTSSAIASRTIGDEMSRIAVAPSGRILGIAGPEIFSATRLPVAALDDEDGAPDSGLSPSAGYTFGAAVTIEDTASTPDGGVLTLVDAGSSFKVARFRPDGAIDTGFGSGGVATLPPALNFTGAICSGPNGEPVAVGRNVANQMTAVRLTSTGSTDPTFDGDGTAIVTTLGAGTKCSTSQTGEVVIATSTKIIRLTPAGAVDSGFAGGAIVLPVSASVEILTVDSAGRVLYDLEDGDVNTLLRVDRTGAPDSGFNGNGQLPVPAAAGLIVRPESVALRPGGAGYAVLAERFPTGGGAPFATVLWIGDAGALTVRDTWIYADSSGIGVLPDGRVIVPASFGNTLHAVALFGAPPAVPQVSATAVSSSRIDVSATGTSGGVTQTTLSLHFAEDTPYWFDINQGLPQAADVVTTITKSVTGLAPDTAYVVRASISNLSGSAKTETIVVRTPPADRPPPATKSKPSTARITIPAKRLRNRVSAWRTLRGTATLSPGARAAGATLRGVEVSVVKRTKNRRGKTTCRAFTGTKFAKRSKTCAAANGRWVTAKGTARWTLALKGLGRGTYVVRVRAVNSDGVRQTQFKTGTNRLALKLTRLR